MQRTTLTDVVKTVSTHCVPTVLYGLCYGSWCTDTVLVTTKLLHDSTVMMPQAPPTVLVASV